VSRDNSKAQISGTFKVARALTGSTRAQDLEEENLGIEWDKGFDANHEPEMNKECDLPEQPRRTQLPQGTSLEIASQL
jgi:hypothetical protein